MDEKLKEVLRHAALIVAWRSGDVDTEDGCYATTDLDTIIGLQSALCAAFETSTDDAHLGEILPQIDGL